MADLCLIITFFVHLGTIPTVITIVEATIAVMFTLLLTTDTQMRLLIAGLFPQKVAEAFLVAVLAGQAEVLAEAEVAAKS